MASASKTPKNTLTVGIDLGGTKAAAALVNSQGKILAQSRRPTVPPWLKDQDPRAESAPPTPAQVRKHVAYVVEAIADAVMETIDSAQTAKKVSGVGLASAGPMNIENGTLIDPSNFKGWKTVPLVRLVQEALNKRGLRRKVSFQNDAMAAALGEGWVGRARGCSTYAMITVGTGIGGGVVFRGQPAQSKGMGSEWGHLMVNALGIGAQPETLHARSVEGLVSGTGLILRARERGFHGTNAAELAEAARAGDPIALQCFAEGSEALAALFYSLSLGFHPDKFIISGGMLAIKDLFLPRAIEIYRDIMKRKNPAFLAPVQVAQLGTKAGVIGAARLPNL